MVAVDAAARWRAWSIKIAPDRIPQLLSALDRNLPSGWRRLTDEELAHLQTVPSDLHPIACYMIEVASKFEVTVSLRKAREGALGNGAVWLKHLGPRYEDAWCEVMHFLDEGLVPAAKSVGTDVEVPSFSELFLADLPFEVSERLRTFSRKARKRVPLSQEEADLWRGFVVTSFRARLAMDLPRFTDWLIADGWSKEVAEELTSQFVDQCQLLSRYADDASAA